MTRVPTRKAPSKRVNLLQKLSGMVTVLTTFDSEDKARKLVRTVVRERLAACGTLFPGAQSIYGWKGKVTEAREIVVLFKTTDLAQRALTTRLKELHPYDAPEILVWTPKSIDGDYSDWLAGWIAGR
jgi:periplasmic divalent cation tolerance protein